MLGRITIRFYFRVESRIRVRTMSMIGVHVMVNVRDNSMVMEKS